MEGRLGFHCVVALFELFFFFFTVFLFTNKIYKNKQTKTLALEEFGSRASLIMELTK